MTAGIYLNAGSYGPLPAEVRAAMSEIETQELATGRAAEHVMDDVQQRVDELRGAFAGTLATDLDLVAIGHSTTESILRAVAGIRWSPGDRIVTFDEEYPAIRGSLASFAAHRGLMVQTISLRDAAGRTRSNEEVLTELLPALNTPTRLLLFSAVSWISGRVLPLREMLDAARERGVISVVDGAQWIGARRDDIDRLDPDWLAFPSQKWLLGVEGIAGVRISRRALEGGSFVPLTSGFLGFQTPALDGRGERWGDARAHQLSGFSRPNLVGAARAAGWLSMQVGLPWAVERSQRLAEAFSAAVRPIPGVELLAPPGSHATIVSLRVANWEAEQLVQELGRRAFAITRHVPALPSGDGAPASAAALRTSWGFWNSDAEVARIAALIELFAQHTPSTLPPRPTLEILHESDRAADA
ncbi:MAG: aminotransferase class V-fold PLP-dependent enzyme [bacterium]